MFFKTIVCDPPWQESIIGRWSKTRNSRPDQLTYPTMSVNELAALPVAALPVADLADPDGSHLYLWTTSRSLPDGFALLEAWGFKYLNTVTWVKPSGFGSWWVNRTQIMLMGYRGKCQFRERFRPNVLFAPSRRHSQKPEASYELIEQVSFAPRLELFARCERPDWLTIGNHLDSRDIRESLAELKAENSK